MSRSEIGLSTLECARLVVENHPSISSLTARRYTPNSGPAHGYNEEKILVSRADFLSNFDPYSLIGEDDPESNIALDSPVTLESGDKAQFLMMDLYLPKSEWSLKHLEKQFREHIIPQFGGGFVLETKDSYHYLGKDIANQERWLDFLGWCLLASIPVIGEDGIKRFVEVPDTRYIGYAILRRTTGLRLTSNGPKTFRPQCVTVFD